METLPTLQPELWRHIATVNVVPAEFPYLDCAAYWVLVRVARRFAIADAKALFIRKTVDFGHTATILPNGDIHSVNDEPAFITDHKRLWCSHNRISRATLPAVIFMDGTQIWIHEGKLRMGLPYSISGNGSQKFSLSGDTIFRDRVYDEPTEFATSKRMTIDENGCRWWGNELYVSHRDVLPAFISAIYNMQWWYQNGKEHREYGLPFSINMDGSQGWTGENGRLTDAAVVEIRRGWFDEWHERGLFLDLTVEDIMG